MHGRAFRRPSLRSGDTDREKGLSLSRLPPLAVSRERSIKVNSTPAAHTSSAAACPSSSSYEREAPSSLTGKRASLQPSLGQKGKKGLHHKRRLCIYGPQGARVPNPKTVRRFPSPLFRPSALGNQPPKQCVGLSPLDRSLPLSCLSIPVPEKWREREMGDLGEDMNG